MSVRNQEVHPNWAFATIRDIVVLSSRGSTEPVEADVAGWVAYLRRHKPTKVLIHSLGSAPDSAQRQRIAAAYANGPGPRILLLTESRAVRFVAETFRWLVRYDIHSLPPAQLASGLEWLGYTGASEQVERLIRNLNAELRASIPSVDAPR